LRPDNRTMDSSVISNLKPHRQPTTHPATVMSEVVFGQRTKNCTGAGICKISMYRGERRRGPCNKALAEISRTGSGLVLRFQPAGICPKLRENYFSNKDFFMGEPVPLPPVICGLLGLPPTFLPAGSVPIRREGYSFVLYFPILSDTPKGWGSTTQIYCI